MSSPLQTFLAAATTKAAQNLIVAYERIPEDKRAWSPETTSRSAASQLAECVVLNGHIPDLIATRTWSETFMAAYPQALAETAAQDLETLRARLHENVAKVVAAIEAIPDSDLDISIEMPWGPQTVAETASYPYWNMSYHEGQINYIASMLGTLP